jgi:hypothetical protein
MDMIGPLSILADAAKAVTRDIDVFPRPGRGPETGVVLVFVDGVNPRVDLVERSRPIFLADIKPFGDVRPQIALVAGTELKQQSLILGDKEIWPKAKG